MKKKNGKMGGDSKRMTVFKDRGPETIFKRISEAPDRTFVRLRYVEPPYVTGSLTGGAIYVDKFALNSTYDPYLGAGGGQPSGLARMFAEYKYCRVHGSTIKAHVARTEHSSDYPYDMCLVPISYGGVGSPPTILSTYIEQPYSKYQRGVTVYADQAHTLQHTMTTAKLAGTTVSGIQETKWFHDSTANCTYNHEWHLVLSQPDVVVNNTILQISVEIVYDCEFFMRNCTPTAYIDKLINYAEETGLKDRLDEHKVEVVDVVKPSSVVTTTTSISSPPVVRRIPRSAVIKSVAKAITD
jgi:hypothetical protein